MGGGGGGWPVLWHLADFQWLWFVFGYSVETNHLARGSVTSPPTQCWPAVVVCGLCLVTECRYKPLGGGGGDMCTNTTLTCSGCGCVWLQSVDRNHLVGWGIWCAPTPCWLRFDCVRFVFGYRVLIQTTWPVGGRGGWHVHQHHTDLQKLVCVWLVSIQTGAGGGGGGGTCTLTPCWLPVVVVCVWLWCWYKPLG